MENIVKANGRSVNNRIWVAAVLLFAMLFSSVHAVDSSIVSAVALEQTARCGVEEHTHTQSCYSGQQLTCVTPQHAHNENCYLVLLKDNDINALLTQVDTAQSNNLETVIADTVGTALQLSDSTQAQTLAEDNSSDVQVVTLANTDEATAQAQQEAQEEQLDIAQLNQTIAQNDLQPGLVLNENLYKAVGSPTDLELPEQSQDNTAVLLTAAGDSGISTLSVGDAAQTGNYDANFYVYLDNQWTCFGTMTFSVTRNGWYYYAARVSTGTMVDFINDNLGTEFSYNELDLRYATSANSGSWTQAQVQSTYTYFGSTYGRQSTAQQAKYIRLVDSNGDPLAFYTVTMEYPDGSVTTQYVRSGESVTLPEVYQWSDGDTQYAGGQTVAIYEPKTFAASEDDGQLRIVYNISFPTVSGVTVATRPTLYGTAQTSVTDTVEENGSTVIRNVSQHEVVGKVDANTTNLSRIIRFSGWRVGDTDTILSPNSTLTWEELQTFSGGTRLTLYGVWETLALQTASFFVRYDSVAVDSGGNVTGQDSNLYTPELFATHVGGEDAENLSVDELNNKYRVTDTTADNSFGADQAIRALYGEQPGIWLQSFPKDEDIFDMLKDYAQYLSVDGEPVSVNDLHSDAYAIRWYVFKAQDDAWHVDGRLVKKQGVVYVKKSFAGNWDGIALAKQDFSIVAANVSGTKSHTLTLSNYDSYDPATDTYLWEITGLDFGEQWNLTEYTYDLAEDPGGINYHGYAEYIVIDAFNQQNKNGSGTQVDITAQTYALDAGTDQVMRVEFTNVYHTSDSIIIKKEDARTGNPLAGATFRLLQNGQPLNFTYFSEKNQYIYDPDGTLTELSGSTSGYYELVISGFSYDSGNVVVQELEAPVGYTPIENITIGHLTDPDTGQLTDEVGILSTSPLASYHGGLLIIENSTENTSVTVNKQWLCPQADWADVTVQLLANGHLVSSLIPGVEPTVQLTAANNYTQTWSGLPAYANGAPITWSVRETKIGTESCKTDFTFANWLVSYSDPVYTTHSSGRVTNTAFTIQNDTRRTLLRLTKTNLTGTVRLPGATFTLQHLIPDGSGGYTTDSTFVTRTVTTGSDGTLTFDNLLYGYYRLLETSPPDGYEDLLDPIYLTIQEDGTVVVEEHTYAQAGATAYTVHVMNVPKRPLPATGGSGPGWYQALGIALMLGAAWVWGLPLNRAKGRMRSDY